VRIYLPATESVAEPARSKRRLRRPTAALKRCCSSRQRSGTQPGGQGAATRGYKVFEARSGEEALHLTETAGVRPDLLITDVIMPGLSGPSLAARLLHAQPHLRVLYLSATRRRQCGPRRLPGQAPLLQKPFTPSTLAERIRAILDAAE
jgi:CheY-like chemotaxis protein